MPKPTRDDVRAAIDRHGAVDWRGVEDTDAVAGDAVEAVMPFVEQSYEAGMAAVTEHLRQELAKAREQMERAEDAQRASPDDDRAWLTYSYAQVRYNAWRDAFSAAQNFSVGNAEKSTGVAWPGATPHVEGEA